MSLAHHWGWRRGLLDAGPHPVLLQSSHLKLNLTMIDIHLFRLGRFANGQVHLRRLPPLESSTRNKDK